MGTAIWVVSGIVAFAFVMAGAMKLMKSREDIIGMGMGWAEDFSDGQVQAIGAAELLGGIGVVLPAATGIVPILSPIAAGGLALVMLGAAATHLKRSEVPMVVPPVVLAAMAGFVAWGRFVAEPIVGG